MSALGVFYQREPPIFYHLNPQTDFGIVAIAAVFFFILRIVCVRFLFPVRCYFFLHTVFTSLANTTTSRAMFDCTHVRQLYSHWHVWWAAVMKKSWKNSTKTATMQFTTRHSPSLATTSYGMNTGFGTKTKFSETSHKTRTTFQSTFGFTVVIFEGLTKIFCKMCIFSLAHTCAHTTLQNWDSTCKLCSATGSLTKDWKISTSCLFTTSQPFSLFPSPLSLGTFFVCKFAETTSNS